MLPVPPSAALVAWSNAWLTGHVGLDEAVDAVEHASGPHVVTGLPGMSDETPLRSGLARLRMAGMSATRLALPVPGDPLGLAGPPTFNAAAMAAGEAVLVSFPARALGLVPTEDRRGSSYVGVRWRAYEADTTVPDVPSLADADHALNAAIRAATRALAGIDRGEWGPEVVEALAELRQAHHHDPTSGLAPGYPPRAHRVATLAARLAVAVRLARSDEGRGHTAAEMARRRDALSDLDRALRRARVAACNSVIEPAQR